MRAILSLSIGRVKWLVFAPSCNWRVQRSRHIRCCGGPLGSYSFVFDANCSTVLRALANCGPRLAGYHAFRLPGIIQPLRRLVGSLHIDAENAVLVNVESYNFPIFSYFSPDGWGSPSGYPASHRRSEESTEHKGRDDQSSRDALRSERPWSLLK